MSKHTPGPWKPTMRVPEAELKGFRAGVMPERGEGNKSFAICVCLGPDAIQNARLIAAAPHMYALLLRVRNEGELIDEWRKDCLRLLDELEGV